MIEKEYKSIINRNLYEILRTAYNWDQSYKQTNSYYLDNKNIIKLNHATVRVREKEGKYKLQIKHKNSDKCEELGALSIRKEYELELKELPNKIDGKLISNVINVDDIEDAFFIGNLTTIRYECNLNSDVQLCLDKSIYLNNIDYEVELEYKNCVEAEIFNKLMYYGVDFNKKSIGKFTRFMAKYR